MPVGAEDEAGDRASAEHGQLPERDAGGTSRPAYDPVGTAGKTMVATGGSRRPSRPGPRCPLRHGGGVNLCRRRLREGARTGAPTRSGGQGWSGSEPGSPGRLAHQAVAAVEVGQRLEARADERRLHRRQEDGVGARGEGADDAAVEAGGRVLEDGRPGGERGPAAGGEAGLADTPVRPAKRSARARWPAPSRQTARMRLARKRSWASASRLTQARSCGGSAEAEQTAVAVRPARTPPAAVVTSVTPAASWRMPATNWAGSTVRGAPPARPRATARVAGLVQ
jgi:hypothetical protein